MERENLKAAQKSAEMTQQVGAGEDINCRYYLSYKLKTISVLNDMLFSEQRRKRTQEELQAANQEVLRITEKYSTRGSKWSGNVIVDDKKCWDMKVAGQKLWNCDILLKSTASDKTIIHEHLRSYLNMFMIVPYSNMEKTSVELLAREICRNEGIPYKENLNKRVDALRQINEIVQIRESNLNFAVSLFGKKIERRYEWLKGRIEKHLLDNPQDKEILYVLLKQIKGIK